MRGPLDHADGEDALIDADTEKILAIGHAFFAELEADRQSSMSLAILGYLDEHLDDPRERALFGFAPLLDYDNTLKPFKPRR